MPGLHLPVLRHLVKLSKYNHYNTMASSNIVSIDGSYLEGGGQILRMGLALSAIQTIPINVTKVRAGRANPGLRPQHLTGLQLLRDICNGKLEGGQIGSSEITFYPGSIEGGDHMADTQTAGSVSLLIQSALPCAIYGDSPTRLTLRGGTNAEMAPQVDYTLHVFRKVSAWFGLKFKLFLNVRGFFPKGRGEVSLEIEPIREPLWAADFTDFGEVSSVYGTSYVAGTLPVRLAHNMADSAEQILREALPRNVSINIHRVKEPHQKAFGNGSGITLWAETTTGCVLGGSALGKRDRTPEVVGETAARELMESLDRKACLDSHAQDQVVILMALAKGKSIVRTGPLTDHSKTAIHVAELMTKAKFTINKEKDSDCITMECEGIGFTPKKR